MAGMNTQNSDSLLTQEAAATLLDLGNPRTLAAWRLHRKGPPYIRIGSSVRYRRSDLDAWLDRNRVDPAAVIERVSND